jgi:hypothetical protein
MIDIWSIGKEAAVTNRVKHMPEETEEDNESPQDTQCPGQYSNWALSECSLECYPYGNLLGLQDMQTDKSKQVPR